MKRDLWSPTRQVRQGGNQNTGDATHEIIVHHRNENSLVSARRILTTVSTEEVGDLPPAKWPKKDRVPRRNRGCSMRLVRPIRRSSLAESSQFHVFVFQFFSENLNESS